MDSFTTPYNINIPENRGRLYNIFREVIDERTNRAVMMGAIDNVVKGAAGYSPLRRAPRLTHPTLHLL